MRWLHIWIGLISSVMIIVISVTGILLVHRKDLQLNQVTVPVGKRASPSAVDGWSGVQLDNESAVIAGRQGVLLYEAGRWRTILDDPARVIVLNGGRLWAGTRSGLHLSEDNGETWHSVISGADVRAILFERNAGYAASNKALYRLNDRHADEMLRFSGGATEVRQILAGSQGIMLVTKTGIFSLNSSGELVGMGAAVHESKYPDLQKIIAELHAGSFFGWWFTLLVDATAVSMIFLAVSGLWLHRKIRLNRKKVKSAAFA